MAVEEKAELPMSVTDDAKLMLESAEQPLKALLEMLVVPSGMVTWPLASGVIQHPAYAGSGANATSRRTTGG